MNIEENVLHQSVINDKLTIVNGDDNNRKFLCILHFNDCYNVEPGDQEPVGGAARFVTALNKYNHFQPLVLFSGDIIAPSIMSTFTKGEQMISVLKRSNVDCALFGNHEFECLISFVKRTDFPWLMSNVIYKKTQLPLGNGEIFYIIERNNIKIGLIGLIEQEWLSTLVLDENDIHYIDFVKEGRKLAKNLKEINKVDIVIALTHMRMHNDIKLAENVDEIDLILGGHDHIYNVNKINNKLIIKSGTDFRQFSKINLILNNGKIIDINVEEKNVTSDIEEDPFLLNELNKYKTVLEEKMDNILAYVDCDLDGRFSSVRTKETNLGNLITDIMLYAIPDADFALLNSGGIRSDRIHSNGPLKMRDLVNILPYMESLLVININSEQIYRALENGVSQCPKFEGRFPQISGINFEFNLNKNPGNRVNKKSIIIQGKSLEENKLYKMVTKEFIAQGKDGYEMLKECSIYKNTEQCLTMHQAFQEYIETMRMIQIINKYKNSDTSLNLGEKIRRDVIKKIMPLFENLNANNKEKYICRLSPKIENRITIVN